MSSTTFSALQEKFAQAEETPTVAAPVAPEPTQVIPESQPTVAAPAIETAPEPTASAEPQATPSENGEVTDTADFALSFEGEEPASPETTPVTSTSSFNLDEEIKKIPRAELLKKLGVNDFIIGMDEHYAKGGKIDDYVYARGVDYNQVSDEDLIKEDYRKKYSNFSKDEVDRMFNKKYGVSSLTTDEEREDIMLEMKAEGHLLRQNKIREQQNFKFPDPIAIKDESYEQWKQQQQNSQQQYQAQVNFYNNHAATKTLNESKRVALNLGEGIQPLNIVIDKPELITRAMTDDGTIMNKLMTTQSGEPDVAKEQLFTLFAFNPQKFIQTVFNYGMQQGVYKKLVNENQNAQRPAATVLPMSPDAKPVFRNGTYGALRQQ